MTIYNANVSTDLQLVKVMKIMYRKSNENNVYKISHQHNKNNIHQKLLNTLCSGDP